MDKLIYKDFASWKLDNQEILEKFHINHNVIYERLEPVYIVLNYIYDMIVDGKEVDEDLEIIFEAGFSYLGNQFEVIKIYFQTLFQSNCEDFTDYSELVLYLIYLLDLRSDLENNDIDSNIEELNELETTIENMIMDRKKDYPYISDLMNKALSKVYATLDYEYVSIVDIFVEIAENLGIFLYEDQDYTVGKDI